MTGPDGTEMKRISAESVHEAMAAKKDFVLLDVRTPGEFSRGKLDGAVSMPLDELETKILDILPDKGKTVYVYCLSGSRSMIAVGIMMGLGYMNVFDLENGLLAWRAKGYPMT